MADNGMTATDYIAVDRANGYRYDRDDNGSWIWILVIFFAMMFMGGFNNRDMATQSEMNAGFNNRTTQSQLQQISQDTLNNRYEFSRVIDGQTQAMLNQQYANSINAIQGFNAIQQAMAENQANTLQAINAMGYQMKECCCDIKTQMLNQRLDDAQNRINVLEAEKSNLLQNNDILGALGRFVPWAGSGTVTGTSVSG